MGTYFTRPYLNSRGKIIGRGGWNSPPPPIYIRQKLPNRERVKQLKNRKHTCLIMLKLTQFLRKIEVKYIISVVYSAHIFLFIYLYIYVYIRKHISWNGKCMLHFPLTGYSEGGNPRRHEPLLCRNKPPRCAYRQTEPLLCRNEHVQYIKMCRRNTGGF